MVGPTEEGVVVLGGGLRPGPLGAITSVMRGCCGRATLAAAAAYLAPSPPSLFSPFPFPLFPLFPPPRAAVAPKAPDFFLVTLLNRPSGAPWEPGSKVTNLGVSYWRPPPKTLTAALVGYLPWSSAFPDVLTLGNSLP